MNPEEEEKEEDLNDPPLESFFFETIFTEKSKQKIEEKKEDDIVAPSEKIKFEAKPSKIKGTKKISIYTKNMQSNLPELKKIAGKTYSVKFDQIDSKIFDEFKTNAERYKIISIMLYLEKENTSPKLISLTAPTITLVTDIRSVINNTKKLFSQDLLELLKDPSITKVIPGPTDWAPWNQTDYAHFLKESTNLSSVDVTFTSITDFISKLNIIPSGKDVCEHMKFIYWIFQIKFESSIIGSDIVLPLSEKWRTMVHKYGSLLCFVYWALENKYENYMEDMTYGTNPDPIYLEYILHDHLDCYSEKSTDEIRKELIGPYKKYPSPPLPNLPRSTKRPQ